MAKKYLSPLNLLNLTSDPGTAAEGDFYWNSSTNRLRIYFDSAWADVSSNTAFTNAANTFTTSQTITPATSVTGLTINAATSSIALILKAPATTPLDITQWQNSVGTVLSVVDYAGRFGLRTGGSVLSSTLAVSPSSSSAVAVTIRGVASQSANLLELQDSAGTNVVFVKANGSVNSRYFDSIAATGTYLDTNLVTNSLVILGRSTSAVTTIIRAVASQTADLIQAQNSAGSVVFKVGPTGVINAGTSTTIGNILNFSDPGITVETRFNFLRATDSAWLAINEMTSDSTYYEFGMADNPSGGDYFQWKFDNWEGPSYGWMPIQMSGYLNRFTAASNTMYGNFALPYNTPYANINNAAFNAATINVNKYTPTQSTTQSLFKDSGTGTGTVTLNAQSFTGSSRTQYWIEIETGATTFKWGNGVAGATPVATGVVITGSAQTLNNGVTVTISATGHVVADKWSFVANPRNTVAIGGTPITGAMEIIYPSSAVIGSVIRGAASQTANLQEWQNSSASVLAKIDASGNLTAASIVKTSGTSAQFLKADGTVDSSTYLTTGTASSTYQPLDADLTAIAALASGTGLLKNTAGTWSLDTSSYLTTGTAASTYLPLTGGTISSDLTITGSLTVNGTTTNLNSTNLVIEDKNIIIADVATPSNTTADGAGITIKGATDKTFTWVNATGYLTSNVGMEATSFVKTSGTSAQFLKADGSVDSATYLTTGTASSTYAPIASPSLTGTPLSTTAASSVSSTQIATTAYVKSLFSSASVSGTLDWNDVSNTRPGVGPTLLLGSATNGPGGGNYYHPLTIQYAGTDGTSNVTQLAIAYGSPANEMWMRGRYSGTWSSWVKFALTSSPTFTGTPLSTTAAVDTNTTQIATTAFVVAQASGANPLALGSVAQGTSLRYSRQDHVHPTTGLALLAGANTFTTAQTITPATSVTGLIINAAASSNGLIVKANATTPADIQQWQISTSAVPTRISANGNLTVSDTTYDGITSAHFVGTTIGNISLQPAIDMRRWSGSAAIYKSALIVDDETNGLLFKTDTTATYAAATTERMRIDFNGTVRVNGFTSAVQGLIVKGAASQTGNLQEWQNSSATVLSYIDSSGKIFANGLRLDGADGSNNNIYKTGTVGILSGLGTQLYLNQDNNATGGSLVIRAINAQTSNLTEWRNVAGSTVLASMSTTGAFSAVTKSFDIPHPTKENMRLRYGSLEGPENGVYVRGRSKEDYICLPDYWTGLVDEDTITVNITPIGKKQDIYVDSIEDNKVYLGGKIKEYFFTVYGERKDVDKITVEY